MATTEKKIGDLFVDRGQFENGRPGFYGTIQSWDGRRYLYTGPLFETFAEADADVEAAAKRLAR